MIVLAPTTLCTSGFTKLANTKILASVARDCVKENKQSGWKFH